MQVIKLNNCARIIAPDDAVAQEWISPRNSRAQAQSLAKIYIAAGVTVLEHHHIQTEEVYFILSGKGMMFLQGEWKAVHPGDAVVILPGERHSIRNEGPEELVMHVTCCPPWTPEDQIF
ncbi:MAG: cupin domain-containing protein [Opitutales bacterium]